MSTNVVNLASIGKGMVRTGTHYRFTGCVQHDVCLLARYVARRLRIGDMIGLRGVVGAGKTTWARTAIQAWAQAQGKPPPTVPSPTYTWLQVYEGTSWTLTHVDLYRLQQDSDIDELGLHECLAQGACLVEWSDKASTLAGMGQYLDIEFKVDKHTSTQRDVTVHCRAASWQERFAQEEQ